MRLIALAIPLFALALLTSVLPVVAGDADAGGYRVAAAPTWVSPVTVPQPRAEADSSDRELLLRDYQIALTGARPVTYMRMVTAVKAPSATADLASLSIDFAPDYQSVVLHHATVLRDGVEVDRLANARIEMLRRENSLESQLIDGRKTLHLLLDDVRVDDVVDIALSIEGMNPALGGRFANGYPVDHDMALRSRQIRVLYPVDRAPAVRLRSYDHALEQRVHHRRSQLGGVVEEVWQAEDIPARAEEASLPSSYVQGTWVEIKDQASWADIVDWALPMYRFASDPRVVEQARALSEGAETPEDAVLSAIRFVQDDIRYTGLEFGESAFRPQTPASVLAQRFGDCKDKSALLIALLEQMGVSASPALVSSWRGRRLQDELPSATVFNHVIVRVQWNGETYWIDPTATQQRGRMAVHTQSQLGSALVVVENNDQLSDIPDAKPAQPLIDISETMDLSGDQGTDAASISYQVKTIYRGFQADSMRSFLASDGAAAAKKRFLQAMSTHYPAIESAGELAISDDVVRNEVTVVEQYRLPEFWTADEDNPGQRNAVIWSTELDNNMPLPKQGERLTPLGLSHPVWIRQRLQASLGGGWTPSKSSTTVDNPHARFRSRLTLTDKHLDLKASYRTLDDEVPVADYATFRRDMQRANENLGYTLSTGIPTATTASASGWADWAEWVDWRLSVILLACLLPWLWPMLGALSSSRSPWLGMFTRPRACMQEIEGKGSNGMIFLLLLLAGIENTVWNDSFLKQVGEMAGSAVWFALGWLLLRAAGGIPIRLLFMAILAKVGRWLGGQAGNREVITATAWAGVPSLAALPASVLVLCLYGANAMTLDDLSGEGLGATVIAGSALLLCLPFALWSIVVWVIALAEVQRFSIGRALASLTIVVGPLLVFLLALVVAMGEPDGWFG